LARPDPAVTVALGLGLVTAALALDAASPASPWRHAYLLPVAGAALAYGAPGGLLAALAAVMLWAPFVLPALERDGPSAAIVEGLVTFGVLLGAGGLGGALVSEAARQRARAQTMLHVQASLAGEAPLDVALPRVQACLSRRLAAEVALVVRDGSRLVVAGGAAVAPGSAVARALEAGAPVSVADAGGGRAPCRVLSRPLVAGGEVIGALAVARVGDLGRHAQAELESLATHLALALDNARLATLQRRAAAELDDKIAAATRRLAETDRLKSEFVAMASHELRTPLTALHGFGELLATRRFAPAEVQRLAEVIRGETARLARLVSDLLDLARLERGLAPSLRRAPVDVGRAVRDALELFRRAHPTHRLEVACAPGLPPVDADADALDRIVKNLVSNALKYSPRGGRVRVWARAEAGAIVIGVEDEGPGIPDEERERIFEPYYRAPDTRSAARGAGIGLAIVKALVEAHGGRVRAEANVPCGARVTLTLPALP
jgi:two-component system sensor histidine kinase KdpD